MSPRICFPIYIVVSGLANVDPVAALLYQEFILPDSRFTDWRYPLICISDVLIRTS